jgi:hypothetical protein
MDRVRCRLDSTRLTLSSLTRRCLSRSLRLMLPSCDRPRSWARSSCSVQAEISALPSGDDSSWAMPEMVRPTEASLSRWNSSICERAKLSDASFSASCVRTRAFTTTSTKGLGM